jgi:hypothetical protein
MPIWSAAIDGADSHGLLFVLAVRTLHGLRACDEIVSLYNSSWISILTTYSDIPVYLPLGAVFKCRIARSPYCDAQATSRCEGDLGGVHRARNRWLRGCGRCGLIANPRSLPKNPARGNEGPPATNARPVGATGFAVDSGGQSAPGDSLPIRQWICQPGVIIEQKDSARDNRAGSFLGVCK